MDDPQAEVLRVIPPSSSGGAYRVIVRCPYCQGGHAHGLGKGGDLWGHRERHCRGAGGYYIEKPDPAP